MVTVKEQVNPKNNIDVWLEETPVEEVYEKVLTKAGHSLGLDVDVRFGGLRTTFTVPETGDKIRYYASDMGFNTSLASYLAKDKVLCSELLTSKGVACIEHNIFKVEDFENIYNTHNFPLVIKPTRGGGGKDVYFVNNLTELVKAYKTIKMESVAVSPYVSFDVEYRVTVLDGKVLMTYGKTKGDNNQNNLSKGAQVITTPEHLVPQLSELALKGAEVLGLRSANIDIVLLNGVTPLILEVNNTVALKRVAKTNSEFFYASINAYTQMLKQAIYDIAHR